MKKHAIDPLNVIFTLMVAGIGGGLVVESFETSRSLALESEGVSAMAEVTAIDVWHKSSVGTKDAESPQQGYVRTWRLPGQEPSPKVGYCRDGAYDNKQVGDKIPAIVHPRDPALLKPDCVDGSRGKGELFPAFAALFGLLVIAAINVLRSIQAVGRALMPRLLMSIPLGLAGGALAAIALHLVSLPAYVATVSGVGLPLAIGAFFFGRHLRSIDRDLAIARGAVSDAKGVAARRLKGTRLGRNAVGRAALSVLLGDQPSAFRELRSHHALAMNTGDLYGLVHGLYALVQRGAVGARTVIEGLLIVGPLRDQSFNRFRAYVLARAASLAIFHEEGAREPALRVESELLASADSEVREYAFWVRAAREAELDAVVDQVAPTTSAANRAREVGLDHLADELERRAQRLVGAGAAYRN